MHNDDRQQDRRFAPWERSFDRIATPFEEFIHRESTSGLLLMGCALLALAVANSVAAHAYEQILHTPLGLSIGGWTLEMSLHHWINDGLMALFFFVVGLEIKREILVGELSDPRAAALPIVAAVGGMAIPALLYVGVSGGGEAALGWGIPMATDIAFAVGVLVLLGRRVPQPLIMFLVALAIVDDLGGVLVIALFYTEQIFPGALLAAGVLLALLVAFNLAGIRKTLPYLIVGALLWLAMLKSGIHATLAGVLTALTIPAMPKYNPARFSERVCDLMARFDESFRPGTSVLANEKLKSILQTLENSVHQVETPLQRLEHVLHLPVAFLVIPVFALANAGIPLPLAELGTMLAHPVTLGVALALVIGKLVGIAGVSWVAIRLGVGRLPAGTDMGHIVGVALLGGIGFTMSIFIAELAFGADAALLLRAKTGVLVASLVAGVAGFLWLRLRAPAARAGAAREGI